MKLKRRFVVLSIVLISLLGSAVALLTTTYDANGDSLFRLTLPTASDIKDTVRDDKYEQLEDKTSLIKGYIRKILDNLL